jgi:hypothetical protein
MIDLPKTVQQLSSPAGRPQKSGDHIWLICINALAEAGGYRSRAFLIPENADGVVGMSGPLHDVTFGPIVIILVIIIVVLAALWLA